MTTTSRRNRILLEQDRSPFILERRRKLFPAEDIEIGSELGHISPLCYDTSSDGENEETNNISDYDIVEVIQNNNFLGSETPTHSKTYSETMSPFTSTDNENKFSPTRSLKTPHDTSTKPNSVLKKEQKTLLEESKCLKRKISMGNSPEQSKSLKLDTKNSKVRTALFPINNALDISLPTESFYSKNQDNILEKIGVNKGRYTHKPIKFSGSKLVYRQSRKFGQINKGVKHKIHKPKERKITKTLIAKATKSLLESGTFLNEYIQDLSDLMKGQIKNPKQIINPLDSNSNISENSAESQVADQESEVKSTKLILSPVKENQIEANKENIQIDSLKDYEFPTSPEDKVRKFFKSSRVKSTKKLDKTLVKKEVPDEQKNVTNQVSLPKEQLQETVKQLHFNTEDLASDFQDEEILPKTNIDNILWSLTEETNCGDENQIHIVNDWSALYRQTNSTDINSPKNITLTNPESGSMSFNKPISSQFKPVQAYLPNCHEPNRNASNQIILEAHSSIQASENSIQLHHNTIANMILSPISHMCDVTSGLALDSPKKARNLNVILNSMPSASKTNLTDSDSTDMAQQPKLFPIFYGGSKEIPERGEKRERSEIKRNVKRFKALPEDQMLLDAGQKKFGYTICSECNTVYHMGDPGDEIEHMNYHSSSNVLRFAGWKSERVVADFHKGGRIIKVIPTDSKIWLKKVKDIMDVVKRDLGDFEMNSITDSQVYFYIKNRTIAGCIVAGVPKGQGHRMLSSVNNVSMCSEESYPIKCGISHMWVTPHFRKQGIATALLNAVKNNFLYGYILSNNDIALSSPTEAGSGFAEKYFKTPNYLIYYV